MIRSVGGFFFVLSRGETFSCHVRGKLKNQTDIFVGDRVTISPDQKTVEDVMPRNNFLYRPPIANVDLLLAVASAAAPPVNKNLLDRLLVLAEHNKLDPVIVINKGDLDKKGVMNNVKQVYCPLGYRVEAVSALHKQGIDNLFALMVGKTTVLAGQSGVGKSTLLNALVPGLSLRTGDVSRKLKGGRHTTREVALFPLAKGGLVADTPGFNRLSLQGIESSKLGLLFPEIRERALNCRFRDCSHVNEPGCAVLAGLKAGEIDDLRYSGYLNMLAELKELERKY